MPRFTYKDIRQFKADDASYWIVKFINPSNLNLVNKVGFPASSVRFNMLEPKNIECSVGPGYSFKVPVLVVDCPTQVTIEFLEGKGFVIHQELVKLVRASPMMKGQALIKTLTRVKTE